MKISKKRSKIMDKLSIKMNSSDYEALKIILVAKTINITEQQREVIQKFVTE